MNETDKIYTDIKSALRLMDFAPTPATYTEAAVHFQRSFINLDQALKGGAPLPIEWLNPTDPG